MAIVKHIKSRNANYSDALDYLIFQHDESTGKMILDEFFGAEFEGGRHQARVDMIHGIEADYSK